jgi:hypothetical protein
VLAPFATNELDVAVIVDAVALGAPGAKVTVSLSVILTPPTVPVITETPAEVDEVNVAV